MAYPNLDNPIDLNNRIASSTSRNFSLEAERSLQLYGQDNEGSTKKPEVYTSQVATLFILVNVTLGIGLLAMPYAMQKAGLIASTVTSLAFLVLVVATCIISVELTVKSNVKSYHEMIRVNCSPIVYQVTQLSILLIVFGTAIAYIVTIGDQSDRLFATLYGNDFCKFWYLDRRFIMIASTLFLMKPLCCLKTVDSFKYASFFGIVSVFFIGYVLFSEYLKLDQVRKDVKYYPDSFFDLTSMLPTLCFSYAFHLSLVPTVATIRKSDKRKAFFTVTTVLFICTAVYLSISIVAVLTFGSDIKPDLIESYPGSGWSTLTTIALVGFKCILTSPAAFLPARLSLVDILGRSCARFSKLSETSQRISVTVFTLDLALLLALLVPNITVAVSLLGFISVLFIFNLPALAYLNLVRDNRLNKQQLAGFDMEEPLYGAKDHFKRLISYAMIVIGLILGAVVLYKSIYDLAKDTSTNESLCKL